MQIIDEWLLITLIFGAYSCALIFFGYLMGSKLPKIKYIRGEIIPDEDFNPGPVTPGGEEDPYKEAFGQ